MDSSDKANTSGTVDLLHFVSFQRQKAIQSQSSRKKHFGAKVDDLYGDIDEMYLSQSDGDTGQFSDSSVSTRESNKTLTSQDEMEQEVNTENDNNQFDDLDLYDDLITEEDQNRIESYQEMVKKYEEAIGKISKMELELQTLRESNMKHEVASRDLQRNFTSLLITAKGELTRKEREISSLRKKLGNKARTSQYGTTPPRTATDTSSLTSIDSNFDPLCVSSPGRVTSKTVSNNRIGRPVSKMTTDHVNSSETRNLIEGRTDSRKKDSERNDSSPHSKSTKRDAVSPRSENKNKQRDNSEHRSRPNSSLNDTDKVKRKHVGSESKRENREVTCSSEQKHTNSTSSLDYRKKELNSINKEKTNSSNKEKTKNRSLKSQTDKDSSEGYSLGSDKVNDKNLQAKTKTPPKDRTKFDEMCEEKRKHENRSRNTEEPKEIKVTDLREKLRLRKLQCEIKDNEIKPNEREVRSLKDSKSFQNNETDSSKLRKKSPMRYTQDFDKDTVKDNGSGKVLITEPENTKRVQKKSNENLDVERAFLEQLKRSIKTKDTLKTPVSVNSKMHPTGKIPTQCTASIANTRTSRAVISYSDVSCDISDAVEGSGFESNSCFSASKVSDHMTSFETPMLSDTERSSQNDILDRFSSEDDSHDSCEKPKISGETKVETQVHNKNQTKQNTQVDNESAGCSQNKLMHEVETCSIVKTDKSELCGKSLTEQSRQSNNATRSDVSFESEAKKCKENKNEKDKSSNKQISSTENSETQRKDNIMDKAEISENSTVIENKNDQIVNEKTPENKDQVCTRIRTEGNDNTKLVDIDTTPVTGRRRSARLISKSESNIDASIPALPTKDLCKDQAIVPVVETSGIDTVRYISSMKSPIRSSEKKKKKKIRRCVISETVSSVTSVDISKSVQDMFHRINVDVDFEESNLESTDGTETSEDIPSSQGSQKIRDSICSDVNCKIKMKHLHPKISPKANEDSENCQLITGSANVISDAEYTNVIKQATVSDQTGCLTREPNTMLHNICSEQTTVINSINDDKKQSVAKTPSDIQTLCIDIAEKNKDTVNTVNNILDNLTENDASDSCNEMLEVAGEASDSESSWDSSSYSSSSFWSSDDDDDDGDGSYTHPSSCSTCSSSYSSEFDSDSDYSTSAISSEESTINKCVIKSSPNVDINQKVQNGRNTRVSTPLVLNTVVCNYKPNSIQVLKNSSSCKDFELSRNNSNSSGIEMKQKLDKIDKNTSSVEIEVEKTLKSLCEKVVSNSSLHSSECDAKDLCKDSLKLWENIDVLNLKNSVEWLTKNVDSSTSAARIQVEDVEDMDVCDSNLNAVEVIHTKVQPPDSLAVQMFDTQPMSKGSAADISPKKSAHINEAKEVNTGSSSQNNSRLEAEPISSIETEVKKSVPDKLPKLTTPPHSLKDNLEKYAKVSARAAKERNESETFKSPKDSEGSFGSNIVSEKTGSLLSSDDSDYMDSDDSYSDDGSGSFYSSYMSESDNSESEVSSESKQKSLPWNTRGNASETSKDMFIKGGWKIKSDGKDLQSPTENTAIEISVCSEVKPADRNVVIEKKVEISTIDDKTSLITVGSNLDSKNDECLPDRNDNSTRSLAVGVSKDINVKLNKAEIKVNDNNTPNNCDILHRNKSDPVTVPVEVPTPQSSQISEPNSSKLKRTNNNRVAEDPVKHKNNSPQTMENIPVTNHSPNRSNLLQCLLQCVQKEVESKYKLSNIARRDGEKENKHSNDIKHENVPVISDLTSSQNLSGLCGEVNCRNGKQYKESDGKGLTITLHAVRESSQRLAEGEEKQDTHQIQTEQKTNKSDLKINKEVLKSNNDLHEEIFGSTLSLSDSESGSSSLETSGSLSDSESLERSKRFNKVNSKRMDERQASKAIIKSKLDDTNIREIKSTQVKVADKKPASCKVSESKNTSTIKNKKLTQELTTDKPVANIANETNSDRPENKNAVSAGTRYAETTDTHVNKANTSKKMVAGTKINSKPQGNVKKVRKQVNNRGLQQVNNTGSEQVNNTGTEQNSCDGKEIQQNVSQQKVILHSSKTEVSNKQEVSNVGSNDIQPTSLLGSHLPKSQSSFMIEDEAPNFLSSRSSENRKDMNKMKSALKEYAGVEIASPAAIFKNLTSKTPVVLPQETSQVKKIMPCGQLGSIDASDDKIDQTNVSSSVTVEIVKKSSKITEPTFSSDKNKETETDEQNLPILNLNLNNQTLQSQNSQINTKDELKQPLLGKKKSVSNVVTQEHVQQGSVKNSSKDSAKVSSKTALHVKCKSVEAPRRSPRKKPSNTEVTLSKDVTMKKAAVKQLQVKQCSNRKNEDKKNDNQSKEYKHSDEFEIQIPGDNEKVTRGYSAVDKQNKKPVKQHDKTRETRETRRASESANKLDVKNAEKYKSKLDGRKSTNKSQLQDEKSRSVGKPKSSEEKQQSGSQSYAKGKISVFEKGHFHDTTKELSDKIMKLKVEQNMLFSKLAEKDKAQTDSLTQKISLSKSKEAINKKDTKENLFASRGKATSTTKTNLSAPLKLAKDLNSHETEKTQSGNIVSKTGCLNKNETLSFEEKLSDTGCLTKSKHMQIAPDMSLSVHTAMLKTYPIPKRSKHTNKDGKNLKSHSELSVLGKMYTTSKHSRERDSYKNKREHSLRTTKQTVTRTSKSQEKKVKISRSDSELSPSDSESVSEGETSLEDDSDAMVKAIFGSSTDSSANSKKSLTLADLRKTRSSEDTEDVVHGQDEADSLSLVDEEDVSSSKSEKRKSSEHVPKFEIRSEKQSETNKREDHNNKDRTSLNILSQLLKEKSDTVGIDFGRKKDSHGRIEEIGSKPAGKHKEKDPQEINVSKKYSKTSLTKEILSPRKSPRLKAAANNEGVLMKSSRTPVKTASENTLEVRYFQLSDENPVLNKIVSPRKTGSDKQKQNFISTESLDLKSASYHEKTVFPEGKGIPVLLLEDNTMDRIDYDDDLSQDNVKPSSYKNKEISENEHETSDGQISETEDNEYTASDDECGGDGDIENDSDQSVEEGELTDDESYKEEHSLVVGKELTERSDEENPTKSKKCDNKLDDGMRKRRHISPINFPSSEDTESNCIEEMCKCKSISCVHKSLSDVCNKKRGKRHRSSSDSCSGVNSAYRQRRRVSRDDYPAGRRSRSPVRYAGSRYDSRSKFGRRSPPRSHRRRSSSQKRGVKKSQSPERRTYRSNRSRSQSPVGARRRGNHSRSRTPVKSGRRERDRHRGWFRDHKGSDKVSPGFKRRHRDSLRDHGSSVDSNSGKADKRFSRHKRSEKTEKVSDFDESVSQNEKSKEQNSSKENLENSRKKHCGSELDEKYVTDSNVKETDESASESRRKKQNDEKHSRLNHREKQMSRSISEGAKGKRQRSESDFNIDSDCSDTDNRESAHSKSRSSHKRLRTDKCTK